MAESSSASGGAGKGIPIDQLSLQDLTTIQKQLDQELQFFQESYQELKVVQLKFRESGDALKSIKPEQKDKEIMVPLTSSMYARGSLKNTETVLVDIGTGYLIDMPIQKARDFFDRKVAYLAKQMETITNVLGDKQNTRRMIMGHLETKVQQMMASQQAQQSSQAQAAK